MDKWNIEVLFEIKKGPFTLSSILEWNACIKRVLGDFPCISIAYVNMGRMIVLYLLLFV